MKPKYITVDNYKEFKPSEFVRSFCADIDVAIKMKKRMNMEEYEYNKDDICLPCLGGMACLNMGIPNMPGEWESDLQKYISYLGNGLRFGSGTNVSTYLMRLFPKLKIKPLSERGWFKGTLSPKELKELKLQVEQYADELESLGY